MKRFLVETELDRTTREADDEEIDTQSSVLRVKAAALTAAGLGEQAMTMKPPPTKPSCPVPYVVADSWAAAPSSRATRLFSLYTGKKLFSATGAGDLGDWLTMGKKGPNYQQRIVAAHLAFTPRDARSWARTRASSASSPMRPRPSRCSACALRAPDGRDGDLPLEWCPSCCG
jgi:hypothetical protein